MKTVLGIFCKQPIPGKVKTRLAADIGDVAAARLYEGFLKDIVERLHDAADVVLLCYAPATDDADIYARRIAPAGVGVVPQAEGDLGDRLAAFFDHSSQALPAKRSKGWSRRLWNWKQQIESQTLPLQQVVIGSDTPTISRSRIRQAFATLEHNDAVLGRSDDGGYYLIGLNRLADGLFDGIDWSTSVVFDQQQARLDEAGFQTKELAPIPEIDTIDDLHRLLKHPMLAECHHTSRVLDELNLR